MYTTLVVAEDQEGSYFDFVRRSLESANDKRSVELSPHVFAEHSPDGLAIKFSTRILRLPVAFRGVPLVRVIIEHSFTNGDFTKFADKQVNRRRAWATMSDGGSRIHAFLTVWGNTLGSANNLYQDILDGRADWQ